MTLALIAALVLAAPARAAPHAGGSCPCSSPSSRAYALAAVLTAPYVYYVIGGGRPPSGAEAFAADLVNLVVPTMASLGGWWSTPSRDPLGRERRGARDLPRRSRCSRWSRSSPGSGGAAPPGASWWRASCLRSCAPSEASLHANGRELLVLPWSHLADRPLFRNVMPVRLIVFASLAAAVMTALWAASPRPPRAAPRDPSRPRGARARPQPLLGRLVANPAGSRALHDEPLQELPRPQRERPPAPVRHPRRHDAVAGPERLLVPHRRRLHLAVPAEGLHADRGHLPRRDRGDPAGRLDRIGAPARPPEARDDDRARRRARSRSGARFCGRSQSRSASAAR